MKIPLSIFLLSICAICRAASQEDFTESWEGRRQSSYLDSRGNLTVGVGHRIDRPATWTQEQIDAALRTDIDTARNAARRLFPGLDDMPDEMRLILVDMAFQLGETGLSRFVKFRAAVESKDWKRAADELVNSKWYLQSGRRSRHHAAYFRDLR
jgi:lysozyme